MEFNIDKISNVISSTSRLLSFQREREILLGEKFNIFSILKVEKKENETHSAILCELLNPNGSHLKGPLFLSLFLKVIKNESIDIQSAKVETEHHIGKVDIENEDGGRIDIYIKDKNGYSISIENKIEAKDQTAQIKRYFKHNKSKNTVYYLTKTGHSPTEVSRKDLVSGEDFYNISYKSEILEWLSLCIKECVDAPILRESIKQYVILIRKITQTMNSKEEKDLFDLILNHQEEASIISANYHKAIHSVYNKLRDDIFNRLKDTISDKYNIYLGGKVESNVSLIWIKVKGKDEEKVFFGIQGFSILNGFKIGIFVYKGDYRPEYASLGKQESNYWIDSYEFDDIEGYSSNINESKTIYKLYSDEDFQTRFVNNIVEQSISYLEKKFNAISALLKDSTNISTPNSN